MSRLIPVLLMLLLAGGCSPAPEEKADNSRQEIHNQSPVEKSMREDAEQLRKSSRALQEILDKWEEKKQ